MSIHTCSQNVVYVCGSALSCIHHTYGDVRDSTQLRERERTYTTTLKVMNTNKVQRNWQRRWKNTTNRANVACFFLYIYTHQIQLLAAFFFFENSLAFNDYRSRATRKRISKESVYVCIYWKIKFTKWRRYTLGDFNLQLSISIETVSCECLFSSPLRGLSVNRICV